MAKRSKRSISRTPRRREAPPSRPAGRTALRIIGGRLRGRRIGYTGDVRVRPMKDRTREAVFNLIGPSVEGTVVWDLFAGTGAMAFEALSRGAARATLIERHLPTAKMIEANIEALGLGDQVELVRADAFGWTRARENRLGSEASPDAPWLVFCCPPYAFYGEQFDSLRRLLTTFRDTAPPASQLVVEAEAPFDFASLWPGPWSARDYPPAAIGIYQTPSSPDDSPLP